ncbi:MAG: DUF952 domain-containing protein, partial [Acidimicrobiia bacterium]
MIAEPEPFLHLIGAAQWRMALDAGAVVDGSLVADGFIHLSRPDQVAIPAQRLFPARTDLLLLVIDPARLPDEVRWEPSEESMLFPHLFGPLPVAAVTSVLPYRPGPDGVFVAPVGIRTVDDRRARATAFEYSLAERRAAVVVPVDGGFACLDPRVPGSWEHNSLWITGEPDTATIVAEVDRVFAGFSHRRMVTYRPPPPGLDWEI